MKMFEFFYVPRFEKKHKKIYRKKPTFWTSYITCHDNKNKDTSTDQSYYIYQWPQRIKFNIIRKINYSEIF